MSLTVYSVGLTRRTRRGLHAYIMLRLRVRLKYYSIWMSWERMLILKLIQDWECCIWPARVIRLRLWFTTEAGWILMNPMRGKARHYTGLPSVEAKMSQSTFLHSLTSDLTCKTSKNRHHFIWLLFRAILKSSKSCL